jgi:hypothetical protein
MIVDDLERVCQNCSSFFQDEEDFDSGWGVCMYDNAFDPFADKIVEDDNFSSCYELYLEKRFDGAKEACDKFEEPEILEIPEGMDVIAYLRYERMKYQNVDEIVKYFYNTDKEIVNKAISLISTYIHLGNQSAYEGLLKYYRSLGPAETLEDVYLRKRIINLFGQYESERRTVEAYVNELARTPSNNMTRQLFTLIFRRLFYCPEEIVTELLLELLNKKKFSYKMKKRIMEVAGV